MAPALASTPGVHTHMEGHWGYEEGIVRTDWGTRSEVETHSADNLRFEDRRIMDSGLLRLIVFLRRFVGACGTALPGSEKSSEPGVGETEFATNDDMSDRFGKSIWMSELGLVVGDIEAEIGKGVDAADEKSSASDVVTEDTEYRIEGDMVW